MYFEYIFLKFKKKNLLYINYKTFLKPGKVNNDSRIYFTHETQKTDQITESILFLHTLSGFMFFFFQCWKT